MNTIPVAYFCHHKDLAVPPHQSYALKPTRRHPCLLALKIQFLRDAGGFGPFFLLVDSEETKQACSHLEAEDVHAVVIPENYPDYPANFNRRLWNMYHPRMDCEAYHYAAYVLMNALKIPVLLADIAHAPPPDQDLLNQIKHHVNSSEFELIIGISALGTYLHCYQIESLHQFFTNPQLDPYSIYYSAGHILKSPTVLTSKESTILSGVQATLETRLISDTMFTWWSNLVDSMPVMDLDELHSHILAHPISSEDITFDVDSLETLEKLQSQLLVHIPPGITGRPTVRIAPNNLGSIHELYPALKEFRKLPVHLHLYIKQNLLHTISTQILDLIDVLELEFSCEKSDELFHALDAQNDFGKGFSNLVKYCKNKPIVLGISLLPHSTDALDTVYFYKGWQRIMKSTPISGPLTIEGPQFIDFLILRKSG